jgi:hypothetical protein
LIIISLFGLFLGVYLENYNFKKKGQFKGFAEVDVINKSFLSIISDFDSSEYSISKYAGFIKNKKYLLNGLDRLTNLSERFNNEFKSSKLNIKEFYDEDINKYCITDKNKHFDSYIDISTNNDREIKRINLIILNNSKSEVENCFNYIKKILIIKVLLEWIKCSLALFKSKLFNQWIFNIRRTYFSYYIGLSMYWKPSFFKCTCFCSECMSEYTIYFITG